MIPNESNRLQPNSTATRPLHRRDVISPAEVETRFSALVAPLEATLLVPRELNFARANNISACQTECQVRFSVSLRGRTRGYNSPAIVLSS
jgi:hypothetical protein